MKKLYFILSIACISILLSCNKTTLVENYIKELPDSLKPEIIKKYPQLIGNDKFNDNLRTIANDSLVEYLENENDTIRSTNLKVKETVRLLPNKDSSVVLLIVKSGVLKEKKGSDSLITREIKIIVLQKLNNQWGNASNVYLPPEIVQIEKAGTAVEAYYQHDGFSIEDKNDLKVICKWNNQKFEFFNSDPGKFDGLKLLESSTSEELADSLGYPNLETTDEEMEQFFELLKKTMIFGKNDSIIKLTHFPFVFAMFGNVGTGVQLIYKESFIKEFIDNYKPNQEVLNSNECIIKKSKDYSQEITEIPSELNVYEFKYNNIEECYLYFLKFKDGIKMIGFKTYSYGD